MSTSSQNLSRKPMNKPIKSTAKDTKILSNSWMKIVIKFPQCQTTKSATKINIKIHSIILKIPIKDSERSQIQYPILMPSRNHWIILPPILLSRYSLVESEIILKFVKVILRIQLSMRFMGVREQWEQLIILNQSKIRDTIQAENSRNKKICYSTVKLSTTETCWGWSWPKTPPHSNPDFFLLFLLNNYSLL